MVTLSCLIVIAALFSQVAASVPQSAQPKFIDVFFFFAMIRLFVCFLHHSILCTMQIILRRREQAKQEKDSNKVQKLPKGTRPNELDDDRDFSVSYTPPAKVFTPPLAWQSAFPNSGAPLLKNKKKKTVDEVFNVISIIIGCLIDIIGYSVFAYDIVTRDAKKREDFNELCYG